jgi:hypothetical protein
MGGGDGVEGRVCGDRGKYEMDIGGAVGATASCSVSREHLLSSIEAAFEQN